MPFAFHESCMHHRKSKRIMYASIPTHPDIGSDTRIPPIQSYIFKHLPHGSPWGFGPLQGHADPRHRKVFFHQYDQCAIDIKSQAQVAFSAQVLCTIVQTGRSSWLRQKCWNTVEMLVKKKSWWISDTYTHTHIQTHTNTSRRRKYKHIQNTYKHIQTHTNTVEHIQTHTNTYKHIQYNTYKRIQTHTYKHIQTQQKCMQRVLQRSRNARRQCWTQ